MTDSVDGTTTVRDLVGRHPQTRQVFEKHGIDFCCGGAKRLADAAGERGIALSVLIDALEDALRTPRDAAKPAEKDWYAATLGELVQHILDVHHAYMKTALPRLRSLVSSVVKAHGSLHGDVLDAVREQFEALDNELSSHLMKEEQILFPYVLALEGHVLGQSAKPYACFAAVRHPIQQMEHEHDSAGGALEKIREATRDYALPPDACPTFAALYEELQRMEADLHEHIHLENNILFPRAIALEENQGA